VGIREDLSAGCRQFTEKRERILASDLGKNVREGLGESCHKNRTTRGKKKMTTRRHKGQSTLGGKVLTRVGANQLLGKEMEATEWCGSNANQRKKGGGWKNSSCTKGKEKSCFVFPKREKEGKICGEL